MIRVDQYPASRSRFGQLLRAPLRLIPSSAVVPILQGPVAGKRWIVGSGIHRLWLGSYEPAKMKLADRITHPGDVVFDIGANVGIYTLLFSGRAATHGRVIAFEPSPDNIRYLRRHLEINSAQNVDVIEAAVCDVVGYASFDATPGSCVGHLDPAGGLVVRTTTIDAYVAESRTTPALIKIDVEGAEARVLRGAAKTLRDAHPSILLATHSPAAKAECGQLLGAAGYDVREITDGAATYEDELYADPRRTDVGPAVMTARATSDGGK